MNDTHKMLIIAQNAGSMDHFNNGLFAKYALAGLSVIAVIVSVYLFGWGLVSIYNYFAERSLKKKHNKESNGK